MTPRVSLSLPIYNGENFASEAIESVLAQDFDDFELIITDNASTDRTRELCEGYARSDHRIRYIRNDNNIGAAANFNLGFELSKGEFFKWCAHDDIINEAFLSRGIETLETNREAVIAYGELVPINGDGQPFATDVGATRRHAMANRVLPEMHAMAAADRFQSLLTAGWSDNNIFGLMRHSALQNGSLHQKYFGSDCALLAELALRGTFVHTPDMILYNRDHASRSTRIADKEMRTAWISKASYKRTFEHWPRLRHLISIAYAHRNSAPFSRTLPIIVVWSASPMRLCWMGLELIGAISPSLRRTVSSGGRKAVRSMRRAIELLRNARLFTAGRAL